jgi:hypothetical protein
MPLRPTLTVAVDSYAQGGHSRYWIIIANPLHFVALYHTFPHDSYYTTTVVVAYTHGGQI